MKILGAILALILIIAIGGFIYLSMSDVQVEQTVVTKNVPVTSE